MEQWEKEYEEIIMKSKQARENHKKSMLSKNRKDFYNACWEEIETPKGKLYRPKKDVAHKEVTEKKKKNWAWILVLVVLGWSLLMMGVKAKLYVEGLRAVNHDLSEYVSQIQKQEALVDQKRNDKTYVDGKGFNEMLRLLCDVRGACVEAINVFRPTSDSPLMDITVYGEVERYIAIMESEEFVYADCWDNLVRSYKSVAVDTLHLLKMAESVATYELENETAIDRNAFVIYRNEVVEELRFLTEEVLVNELLANGIKHEEIIDENGNSSVRWFYNEY